MEVMTKALIDWETLESDQISQIMDGKQPRPPAPNSEDSSSTGGGAHTPASGAQAEIKPKMDSPAGDSV